MAEANSNQKIRWFAAVDAYNRGKIDSYEMDKRLSEILSEIRKGKKDGNK